MPPDQTPQPNPPEPVVPSANPEPPPQPQTVAPVATPEVAAVETAATPPSDVTPEATPSVPTISAPPSTPAVGQSTVGSLVPPQAKASKKLPLLLGLLVIIILLAAGGGFYYWHKQQNTPDKVFTGALTTLLQTKTVTQTVSDPANSISGNETGDLTNIKNPKVSIAFSVKTSGTVIKLNGWGSNQNGYINYTSFGSASADEVLSPIVNQWVQIRTNGTNAADVDQSTLDTVNPYFLMLGDVFVGNFSASQQQTILSSITNDKIYSYDTKKVTTATVHGKKAYVYAITENIPKLKSLNIKVAAMMGLKASDIQSVLDQLGTSGTTKLYIDVASKEVVQYTTVSDGDTITGSYSDYNTSSLPIEPAPDLTWAQFEQKETAITGTPLGGSSSSGGADSSQLQQT